MELNQYIKEQIINCHKVVDIRPWDNDIYRVEFIEKTQSWTGRRPPIFTIKSTNLNLKVQIRDYKIQELLKSVGEVSDFDVEDYIFTDEEREKLHKLRNEKVSSNSWIELVNARKEYSESFNVGDRVWYNEGAGFITFKHADKDETDVTRWSVKVKDIEYRYVYGTELVTRKVEDLSYIEIDPELNKLSTEKLLKIYKHKRDRNKGRGDINIKRILQDREHVQKNPNKIIVK